MSESATINKNVEEIQSAWLDYRATLQSDGTGHNNPKLINLLEKCKKIIEWRAKKLIIKNSTLKSHLEDLISEGKTGFFKALENYNPEKGLFALYLNFWVDQRIIEYVKHKIPTVTIQWKTRKKLQELENKKSKITEDYCMMSVPWKSDWTDIDNLHPDKLKTENMPISAIEQSEMIALMHDAIEQLPQLEQNIIKHRFLGEKTLSETSENINENYTLEGIRQIELRVLKKLKTIIKENARI